MSLSIRPATTRQNLAGFTIIEIMVVIGIIVLISLGVTTIFSSVSQTVNTGQRVAELNRFAAQFERVMREDFKSMTRDGFMVVVHQRTVDNNGNPLDVQLSPADRSDEDNDGVFGRSRRIDEIMFFTRDQYQTARRAVDSSMVANSSQAAIYYGHGQKRRFDVNSDIFFTPEITDSNIDPGANLGIAPVGSFNPNQYASDWSLLRHVTLLIEPMSSGQDLPDSIFGTERLGDERQWIEDSDRQIALQPATRSIFNSLGQSGFTAGNPGFVLPKWFGDEQINTTFSATFAEPAMRASGLVDIATDNLASIRTVLYGLSATESPRDYWERANVFQNPVQMERSYDEFAEVFWEDPSTAPNPIDGNSLNLSGVTGGSNADHLRNIRLWMLDALPSVWDLSVLGNPQPLSRVRYEDIPTRLLFNEDSFAANDNGQRLRTYTEANQEMLGSSVFIPKCTEFVVEWSYGRFNTNITDPTNPQYKKMFWYGIDRWVDANNDGIIDESTNGVTLGDDQRVAWNYRNPQDPMSPIPDLIVGHPTTLPGFGPSPTREIAAFGYPDKNGNDWEWPKYIRVTVSIADPQDSSIEETFQMVFEIPDGSS